MKRIVVAVLVLVVMSAGCFLGRPPLTVIVAGDTVTIDVQTLGEYPTSVARSG